MGYSQAEAATLAALIHTIRPDWTKTGIWKALTDHHNQYTIQQLTLPAIRAAYDPTITSPAGIFFTDRPHWHNPTIGQRQRVTHCAEHEGQPAHNCASCLADVKAGDRTRDQIGQKIHGTNPAPRPPAHPNTTQAPQEA